MATRSAGILGACIIVAALVVSLVPRLMNRGHGAARSVHSADGRLAVGYMVQTSPTTAEGSNIEGVTDIEFCPNYVVVKTQGGHGKVLFAERTQRLDWSLRPPPPPPPRSHTAPAKPPKPAPAP